MSASADSSAATGGDVIVDATARRPEEKAEHGPVAGSQEQANKLSSTVDAEKVNASSAPGATNDEQNPVPDSEGVSSKVPEKEGETGSAPARPTQDRSDSIMAIGPAVEGVKEETSDASDSSPACNITLLLTTGSRHPYKIDARYLSRRNVPVPEETEDGRPDPFSISIYTLKELILREWRNDWEAKPPSPTSIRLIHFGKLLDDKEPLKKYQFSQENPNVVHMSVRPQDLDEEEPKSGGKHTSGNANDGTRSRGSGCCVIL